jgi:hypothetical protein
MEEADRPVPEPQPLRLVTIHPWQAQYPMALKAAMQGRPRQIRGPGRKCVKTITKRKQGVTPEATTIASCSSLSSVEHGSVGPAFRSLTVSRLRHFATVCGSVPGFRLRAAKPQSRTPTDGGQAFDLRSLCCSSDSVRGRPASVANLCHREASTPKTGSHHQTAGSNT